MGLVLGLAAFWLGMSGHYTALMLSFAAVSILLTVIVAYRFDIIDREGVPYARLLPFLAYYPWLTWEVAKANWVVIMACLKADIDITPTLVKVKTRCKSDLAKATFANSITLTPGTVTVDIDGDRLLVHGLYEQYSQPEAFLEMDRRCAAAADAPESAA